MQAKLLQVLQSGEFSPLGSEKEIKTDTWVIAATNHDLEQDIKEKNFREDLYYRLSVIRIFIPPLRVRSEDIPPVVEYYLKEYTTCFNNDFALTPGEMERLRRYSWPGNIRELQNVLKRMVVLGNCTDILDKITDHAHRTWYDEAPSKGALL